MKKFAITISSLLALAKAMGLEDDSNAGWTQGGNEKNVEIEVYMEFQCHDTKE